MSHDIYKRGEVWHIRGTVSGRRLRQSLGTTDRKTAERLAARIEKDAWERHLDGPGATLTMAQAAIAYRDADKPTRFLAKVEDHWRDMRVATITGEAIRQASRKVYPDAKPATRNRQFIVPTQAIINHAAELGWCSPIKVKRFKVEAKIKTPATAAWVRTFAAQAEKDGLPHLAALCLFMFGTAARIGAAVALKWGDVDLTARQATMRQRKGGVIWTHTAHLPPLVVAALANIGGNRNPDELVFGYAGRDSVRKVWDNVIKRAGIVRLTAHSCRHGFATTMMHAGKDVVTVAKAGGWKDARTVLSTYAHAIEDKSVTDLLFDTPVTRATKSRPASHSKVKGKSA
jgi:integrase